MTEPLLWKLLGLACSFVLGYLISTAVFCVVRLVCLWNEIEVGVKDLRVESRVIEGQIRSIQAEIQALRCDLADTSERLGPEAPRKAWLQ
jgi:hypothetical protein